jgi:hypothetical protein
MLGFKYCNPSSARLSCVELLDQFWSMDIIMVLPAVVCGGVPLPFDQILLLLPSAMILLVQNCLNLILLLSINDVWGRFEIIRAMFRGFLIG